MLFAGQYERLFCRRLGKYLVVMDFICLENLENNSRFYLRELLSQDFLCFMRNKVYASPPGLGQVLLIPLFSDH